MSSRHDSGLNPEPPSNAIVPRTISTVRAHPDLALFFAEYERLVVGGLPTIFQELLGSSSEKARSSSPSRVNVPIGGAVMMSIEILLLSPTGSDYTPGRTIPCQTHA